MDDTLIIIAIVAFVIGWSLGSAWTAIKQAMAFKNILRDLGISSEQLLKLRDRIEQAELEEEPHIEPRAKANEIEIRLEVHNGQIYAYRKDNNQFLAQGTDREQLVASLVEQFTRGNGARLIIREEDGADLVKTL